MDPYRVLGLEPRADLTEGEIKKAYRRKALVLHPDKRKESERETAQREFDQLQKAYDILLDPEARAALEGLAKARAARAAKNEQQDAKRRKLREDLERRERAAERGRNEEEEAKQRLAAELARLKRDFATRKRGYDRDAKAATATDAAATPPAPEPAVPEHMYRTLKVVWRKDAAGDYSVTQLKEIFGVFTDGVGVEDVVIRDGKKKKGSALVVFAERVHAAKAVMAQCGDPTNPLLATRAAVPPRETEADAPAARGASTAAACPPSRPPGGGLFPGGSARAGGEGVFPGDAAAGRVESSGRPGGSFHAGSGGDVINQNYESVVLDRMRRAQERARLIAEMQAAEEAEEAE